MTRCFGVLAVSAMVLLSACGGSASSSPSPTSTVASAKPQPAGVNPSKSARMVCAHDVNTELAHAFGVQRAHVSVPTWVDHFYACQYVFPTGALSVSVKELDDAAQTTAYFDRLGVTSGRRSEALEMGQGAYFTQNGSVVVRLGWKVLFVDVSQLPTRFGKPPVTRSDAGVSVAAVILGCWNGS